MNNRFHTTKRFLDLLGTFSETDAIELLTTIKDFKLKDLAIVYLNRNPDSRADLRALRAIASVIDREVTKCSLSHLFSEESSVIQNAIDAIVSKDINEAVILLAAIMIDENTPLPIHLNCSAALLHFGKQSVEPILFIIGVSASKRIEGLIKIILSLGNEVVSLIEDGLKSPDEMLRKGSAIVSGFFPKERFKTCLEDLKTDPVPEIAQTAKYSLRQIILAEGKFAKYSPVDTGRFKIIGTGEIGNKAKSLAYLSSCLGEQYNLDSSIIRIPYSVVIAVSDFDNIVKKCNIDPSNEDLSFHWVAEKFKKIPLSKDVIAGLDDFLKLECPLIVRSSSLLEGNLRYAFAGIYISLFIPAVQPPEDRLNLLKDAIRTVQASVWNDNAKEYRLKRGLAVLDEKMGVLIQPVTGRFIGTRYYPLASGLALSHNFYPWIPEIPPGAALFRMVYGLGTKAVGHDPACIFSPGYPVLSNMLRNTEDYIFQTQREFDFLSNDRNGKIGSDNVGTAQANDLEISLAAQLYIDGRLVDIGSHHNNAGLPVVITFEPLLNSGKLGYKGNTLQKMVDMLKEFFEFEIAIEFTLDTGTIENLYPTAQPGININVLQVRPHEIWESNQEIVIPDIDKEKILVSTNFALGNIHLKNIDYLVYIAPRALDMPLAVSLKRTITEINKNLAKDKYILIGPGWWGSSIADLGIPVTYADISHSCALVEILDQNPLTPSFGGHLISNILSDSIPLISISKQSGQYLDTDWFDAQPAYGVYGDVKIIQVPEGVEVIVDGRTRRGIVCLSD
jgi:hypothetical protein